MDGPSAPPPPVRPTPEPRGPPTKKHHNGGGQTPVCVWSANKQLSGPEKRITLI